MDGISDKSVTKVQRQPDMTSEEEIQEFLAILAPHLDRWLCEKGDRAEIDGHPLRVRFNHLCDRLGLQRIKP